MAKEENPGMTPEQAQKALYALMAIKNTDIEDIKQQIQQLCQAGADINSTHHNPLIRAIGLNNISAVKALISMDADPRVHSNYDTPLAAAFRVRNPKIIEVLVTAGVDINVALYSAASNERCVGILNRLIELGANPNIIKPEIGLAPLHIASDNGNLEAVKVLIKNGANPNALDVNGRTPFELVGTGDRLTIAKILVMNGADVRRFPARLPSADIVEVRRAEQARAFVNSVLNGTPQPGLNIGLSDMLSYLVKPDEIAKIEQKKKEVLDPVDIEVSGILHAAGILPHAMPLHVLKVVSHDLQDDSDLKILKEFYLVNPQYWPENFLQTISTPGGLEMLFNHPGANPRQLQTALDTLLEVYARMPTVAFLAPSTTAEQLRNIDAMRRRIDELAEAKLTELEDMANQIAKKCPSIGGLLDEVHAHVFTTLNLLSDPQLSSLDAILSVMDPTDSASLLRNHADAVVDTLSKSKLSSEQIGEFTRLVPQLKSIERKDLVSALTESENPQVFIADLKALAQPPQPKLSVLRDVLSLISNWVG